VGSVLACYLMLRKMGKTVQPVLSDGVPLIYEPLPQSGDVAHAVAIHGDASAAIILECDSVQRSRVLGLEGKFLINIDHHSTAREFADVNWFDRGACAVGEMVYRLIKGCGVEITPEMATCLYTAVLTDTGSFCYSTVSEHTFALAQDLVRQGADAVRIAHQVYFSNPTSKMRLLGAALSKLHREGSLAWMHVSNEDMELCGALEEDCEGLVNYALGIAGVEVAVFFREIPGGRFRVSLRSKGAVNVGTIAEQFGGGGHECASGFAVSGPLPAAMDRVLGRFRAGECQPEPPGDGAESRAQ
jgi:phosphoesterase RecJ-like protein